MTRGRGRRVRGIPRLAKAARHGAPPQRQERRTGVSAPHGQKSKTHPGFVWAIGRMPCNSCADSGGIGVLRLGASQLRAMPASLRMTRGWGRLARGIVRLPPRLRSGLRENRADFWPTEQNVGRRMTRSGSDLRPRMLPIADRSFLRQRAFHPRARARECPR